MIFVTRTAGQYNGHPHGENDNSDSNESEDGISVSSVLHCKRKKRELLSIRVFWLVVLLWLGTTRASSVVAAAADDDDPEEQQLKQQQEQEQQQPLEKSPKGKLKYPREYFMHPPTRKPQTPIVPPPQESYRKLVEATNRELDRKSYYEEKAKEERRAKEKEQALVSELEPVTEEQEESFSTTTATSRSSTSRPSPPPLVKEREIYRLLTLESIDQLVTLSRSETTKPTTDYDPRYPPLVIIVLYDPSCPNSMALLQTLERAILVLQIETQEMLQRMEDRQHYWVAGAPLVGKLDIDDYQKLAASSGLSQSVYQVFSLLRISSVPKLLLIQKVVVPPTNTINEGQEEEEEFLVLEYTGLQSNPSDLANGLWHYIYRLQFGYSEPIHAARRQRRVNKKGLEGRNAEHHSEEEDSSSTNEKEKTAIIPTTTMGSDLFLLEAPPPMVIADRENLESILSIHGPKIFTRVTPALDPYWSPQEKNALESLFRTTSTTLEEDKKSDNSDDEEDPFLVVGQCYLSSSSSSLSPPKTEGGDSSCTSSIESSYAHFERVANMLSIRRDVLFVLFETSCDSLIDDNDTGTRQLDDGSVIIFNLDRDWKLRPRAIWNPPALSNLKEEGAEEEEVEEDHLSSSSPCLSPSSSLTNFLTRYTTPSLLWMDRQLTAPIAFDRHNKVHVVLFVNVHQFHHSGMIHEASRQAVRRVRRVCQAWRKLPQNKQQHGHMTCLVVPSTDTRILTTFGIDIWTPLDEKGASLHHRSRSRYLQHEGIDTGGEEQNKDPAEESDTQEEEILPTLLITDQREGGTKRYYLDPPSIYKPMAISDFVRAFWNDELQQEYTSSRRSRTSRSSDKDEEDEARPIPTNRYGVQIFSAEDVAQWIAKFSNANDTTTTGNVGEDPMVPRRKHLLLLLYAPTCGHCKRVSIVWNQLSEIIQSLGWNDFVQVAKLDVTTDEVFVPGMVIKWLPDVYYIGPQLPQLSPSSLPPPSTATTTNKTNTNSRPYRLSRYDRLDALGDGIGGLGGTIELIEWLLDIAELDEPGLLSMLEGGDPPTQRGDLFQRETE